MLSILVAVILIKTGVFVNILTSSRELGWLGSFISGIFFTSIFTVTPATVILGEIAQKSSVFSTAFFGGMGAVIGDLIIFRFISDRFSPHLMKLIQHSDRGRRLKIVFKLKLFRWLAFFVGGLIIASPLPDELGISLLGFSKMRTLLFIPLFFVANFFGILIVGLVAKSLL